jgi:hypothetical protein
LSGSGQPQAPGPSPLGQAHLPLRLSAKIEALSPQTDLRREFRGQAHALAADVGRTRLLLFENLSTSLPVPFLVVLVFWLRIIFASFGLFAPRNVTVIVVLGVCALSVSGAIFLIIELDRSFEGFRSPATRCVRRSHN